MKRLSLNDNHFIEYNQQEFENSKFTILYLHGLMSDRLGTKCVAIEKYCIENQINYVAFDNLGHGTSSGKFTDFNISDWLCATIEFIKKLNLKNIILIGSSMGGWLALLVSQLKLHNIYAMILIAPAPDFTLKIWNHLSPNEKEEIARTKIFYLQSSGGEGSIPITLNLLEDGQNHLLMHSRAIKIDYPVIILHGMRDNSVDYNLSLQLTEKIEAPYVATKLIKYASHRLSAKEDIKVLINSIEELMEM